jgi:hypothetical protein
MLNFDYSMLKRLDASRRRCQDPKRQKSTTSRIIKISPLGDAMDVEGSYLTVVWPPWRTADRDGSGAAEEAGSSVDAFNRVFKTDSGHKVEWGPKQPA